MKKIFLLFLIILSTQVAHGSTIAARQYNFGDDKTNGIPITASRMDGEFNYDITKLNQKVIIAASAPSSPIAGMLWYDSVNLLLKQYRNSEWVINGVVHVGTSSPATNQTGDVWYDSTNKLLKAYNGSTYATIGPVDFSAPNIGIGTITPVAGKFTTLQSTSTAFLQGNVGIGTITASGGALMVQGGNVGIGTVNANKPLTVAGVIYSTSGGIQFPDNTTLATAATTFKFISKTSPSAATNSGDISITNTNYYMVTINLSALSGADSLSLRFNNDSGSNYTYVNRGFDTGATGSNANSAGTTSILLGPSYVVTSTARVASYVFYIFPTSANGATSMVSGKSWGIFNSSTVYGYSDFMGQWNNATATSFRIITTGGANMAGDINLYQIQQQ